MDIKIGDRVSFLNETGGGIVVSIKDKSTVMVSDDDGFTTPYLIKNLVKLSTPVNSVMKDHQLPLDSNEQEQISILYVPKDNTQVLQCDLDMYLVNNSGYNIYFELYLFEAQKVLLFSSGQLTDGNSQLIKLIKREEIEMYCKLRFQCLFNSGKKMEVINPLSQFITIKPSKFYKEINYSFSSLVNNAALLYTIAGKEAMERLKQPAIDLIEVPDDKDVAVSIKKSKANNYLRIDEEVDLHISELLESQIGLTAIQMLQVQLSVFKKELEKAIQLNYASITFIHGIGKGVLKESILNELSSYKGIKYYPASFQKYGNGATKVEII